MDNKYINEKRYLNIRNQVIIIILNIINDYVYFKKEIQSASLYSFPVFNRKRASLFVDKSISKTNWT